MKVTDIFTNRRGWIAFAIGFVALVMWVFVPHWAVRVPSVIVMYFCAAWLIATLAIESVARIHKNLH